MKTFQIMTILTQSFGVNPVRDGIKEGGMKEMKISAVVGVSVTVLAVVTAFVFSFATVAYQKQVAKLVKVNKEYKRTMEEYKSALENIKNEISKAGINVQ